MNNERKKAYLLLLFSSFIWGIAPPIIKYTLKFISPFYFLFYRFLISTLIAAIPLIKKLKNLKISPQNWLIYIILGSLCAPINLSFLFYGIEKTSSLDASIISIISPVLIILGGSFLLKERVTSKEKIGIIITLVGTFLTIIQPLFEYKNHPLSNIQGNILVLIGTFAWVVFVLLAKKNKHLDPIITSLLSFVIGLIFFTPKFLFQPFPLPPKSLPGILYMSIFSSIFAYTAYTIALSKIEASEATVFTYLQPIFAVPIATIFLKEKITLPFILGSFLIITGVFICEYRTKE